MNATKSELKSTTDREIFAERILNAPRELVFRMWTEPESIKRWWGPKGYRTINIEMNVKPGGLWRFLLISPDGIEYPNKVEFSDVRVPEEISYIHSDDKGNNRFNVTTTFEDLGDITKLSMLMLFDTPKERDLAVKKENAVKGLKQTFDRLERYLRVQ